MPGRCVIAGQVCPQTSDPSARRYCPAWWETVAKDAHGNERLMKGCAWAQLPMYLNEFANKAAGAAEAAQQGRNEVARLTEQTREVLTVAFTSPKVVRYAQIATQHPSGAGRSPDVVQLANGSADDVPADSRGS